MDTKEVIARALDFAASGDIAVSERTARQQISEFVGRYPYKERADLLRAMTPDDLFEGAADDRFFNWLQDRTSSVGAVQPMSPAIFQEAVRRFDFFKVLLTVLVSDKKSISSKIDQNWGVIPGFGGEKEIAKKLLSLYYSDFVIPIFRAEEMERYSTALGMDYMDRSIQHFRKEYSLLTEGQKFELLNLALTEFRKNNLAEWTNTLFASFLRQEFGGAEGVKKETRAKVQPAAPGRAESELVKTTQLFEARLRVADRTAKELKSELRLRDERVKELQAELERRDGEIGRLRAEVDRLEASAREQQEKARESASRALSESAGMEELKRGYDLLSEQLKEREERIRLMSEDLERLKESLRQSDAYLEERDELARSADELKEMLAVKDERVKALEEEMASKSSYVRIGGSDFMDMEAPSFTPPETEQQDKVKSGTPRLDDLLNGGIPVGSQMVVYGPSFIGKETAMDAFAAQGIADGVPLIWVTTDKTIEEIREEMSRFTASFGDYEKQGLVFYVDAYSRVVGDSSVEENASYLEEDADVEEIGALVDAHLARIGDRIGEKGYRLVFRSVSSLSTNHDIKSIFSLLRQFVARRRKDGCVAAYSIEKGIMSEQDLQIISSIMDGVMEFSTDGRTNFLSVQGICETQTRERVEYTAGKSELSIGSFFLGRIK